MKQQYVHRNQLDKLMSIEELKAQIDATGKSAAITGTNAKAFLRKNDILVSYR